MAAPSDSSNLITQFDSLAADLCAAFAIRPKRDQPKYEEFTCTWWQHLFRLYNLAKAARNGGVEVRFPRVLFSGVVEANGAFLSKTERSIENVRADDPRCRDQWAHRDDEPVSTNMNGWWLKYIPGKTIESAKPSGILQSSGESRGSPVTAKRARARSIGEANRTKKARQENNSGTIDVGTQETESHTDVVMANPEDALPDVEMHEETVTEAKGKGKEKPPVAVQDVEMSEHTADDDAVDNSVVKKVQGNASTVVKDSGGQDKLGKKTTSKTSWKAKSKRIVDDSDEAKTVADADDVVRILSDGEEAACAAITLNISEIVCEKCKKDGKPCYLIEADSQATTCAYCRWLKNPCSFAPKDEANMTGRRAKNAKEKQMKRQADARASREGRGDPAPERDVQWEQHLKLRLWQKQAKDKKPVEKKVQKKPQSTESKAEVMAAKTKPAKASAKPPTAKSSSPANSSPAKRAAKSSPTEPPANPRSITPSSTASTVRPATVGKDVPTVRIRPMPRKVTTPKDSPPPVTVPTGNVKAGRPAESTVSKPSTIEGSNTTGNTDLGRKATQAQTSQYDRTRGVPEEVGKKHPAPRPIQADLPGGRQHAPNGRMTATPRAPQFTSPALEDVDSPVEGSGSETEDSDDEDSDDIEAMSPVKVVEMFIHGRITKKQHRRVGIRFADRLDKALAYMEEMPFRMDAVEETLKGNGRGGLPGLEQKMDVISAKIDARDAIVQTKMDGIITNVDALRSKVDKSAEVAGEVTKMSSALTTFTADANGQLTTIAKSTAYIHEHNVVTTNLTELKDAKNAEAMAILNRQQETAVAVIEGLRKQVVDLTLAKVKHPGEAEARDHPTKIDKAVGNDFDVGGEVARQNEKAAIETADDGQKAAGDVAGEGLEGTAEKADEAFADWCP